MALPLHSNPPWGLSLTTLPPPLLPTTRIHFPLRSTSLRVSIQMKEAPLRVILWAEVRRGCSSAQYLVLDIHLQGRQYRKPLFQAMKRQLCFNFHYKVYRCLAVLVGCVRQCPEPSLYYNIKIFFFLFSNRLFSFPTRYSLFITVGNLQFMPFLYDAVSKPGVIGVHMPTHVLCSTFLFRPPPAKQHYSSQGSEATYSSLQANGKTLSLL